MAQAVRYDQRRYEIESEYGQLGEEETRSGQVCPSCKGGAAEEASFSVTRRGGVLVYQCHRASCRFRGSTGTYGTASTARRPNSRAATIRTTAISEETLSVLAKQFGIPRSSFELAELSWTGDGDGAYQRRVCYPIFGPDSKKRGENYRSYEGKDPKSIIRLFDDDAISACWYRWKRKSSTLIIVEDQVSAIKLAPFYDTLALLGTNLSEAKVDEIVDLHYKDIYLCLDNDATFQAIKLQLMWKDWLRGLKVRGLDKDIKDMTEEELDSFMLSLL